MKKAKAKPRNKRLAELPVAETAYGDWDSMSNTDGRFCSLRKLFEFPLAHGSGVLVINSQPHPQGYEVAYDGRDWRWSKRNGRRGIFFLGAELWLDDNLGRGNTGWITFES